MAASGEANLSEETHMNMKQEATVLSEVTHFLTSRKFVKMITTCGIGPTATCSCSSCRTI